MLLVLVLSVALLAGPVFAAEPSEKGASDAGAISGVKDAQGLSDSVKAKEQQLADEVRNMTGGEKDVRTHGNAISLAVHALLSSENLTDGIGKNVSAIARDFNGSIKAREDLELQINGRGGIVRAFFGGDEKAAHELWAQLNTTGEKLAELKLLLGQCANCSADVVAQLQTQIDVLQAEQDRQGQLVQKELADKGFLGWLFK